MSLRARLLAGITAVAVVLVVVLAVITRATEANLLRQVDDQLAAAVGPVRALVAPRPALRGPGGPDGLGPRGETRRLSAVYVGVVEDGDVTDVVAPDLRDDTAVPDVDAERAVAAARSGEPFTVEGNADAPPYRVRAYVDRRLDSVVVLGLPIDSVERSVEGLIAVEAVGAVVILLVLGLVAWWVVHLGIRPVRAMTGVATRIAGGDLSERVPDEDPRTEAGQLGRALNEMLGRIEGAFAERAASEERLRRFVADASHELRTPVATIRGYAELHRTGGLDTSASLDDAMRRTEQEAVRMGSLVQDLLDLARLDQARELARERVDLSPLVEDAAGDARAVDRDRPIDADVDGAVVVLGDEQRLRQVIANVVGNALVHTEPGTPIVLRAFSDGPNGVVEVVDHGPGMPDEVALKAFERFYRADPARSRERGGSGLGLSIVEAIVRAHGGNVRLSTAPGRGTTVRIELPSTDDPAGFLRVATI